MNWLDMGELGANILAGGASAIGNLPQPEAPRSPLNEAVSILRRRGHSVVAAEGIPGLFDVSGVGELTINQVISFSQKGE